MTYGRGGSVRAFLAVILVFGLAFLAGCSSSGTPAGVSVTIALSASQPSLTPGQSSTITATVTNDPSNKGVTWTASPSGFGTLGGATSTSVVYTAPASVPTATAVTITATSIASSTVTASIQISVQTSAIAVSLSPAAPQTINQGGQLSVNAALTNDTNKQGVAWTLSPATVGTLSNPTTSAVTYIAPSSVTTQTLVTLTATSIASSAATAKLEITVFPSGAGPNVSSLTVTTGPVGNSANLAFVSVTLCVPGAVPPSCQTVDNVQVDTGSVGLRILQSAIPALVLQTEIDPNTSNTILNCVNFADGSYLWGPVQIANVEMGGEVAGSTPIQVVSTSTAGIPTGCSNGSTSPGDENTPTLLAANGILGVGLEPTDCIVAGTDFCDGSAGNSAPNVYFECPASGCAPVLVSQGGQVTNPVVLFSVDDNGVVIDLPAVTSVAPTVSGSLIFGIDTESNNAIPNTANVFGLDTNDNFITMYGGQDLTASFIDSGSSALFFPSTLTVCTDNIAFYCPASLTPQSATNEGASGIPTSLVNFSIDNADNLFNNNPGDAAFGTVGGPNGTAGTCTGSGGACTFDWGLPFFYGRPVFTAIDGQAVSGGTGPFWAY
jgi:hypothetical protein